MLASATQSTFCLSHSFIHSFLEFLCFEDEGGSFPADLQSSVVAEHNLLYELELAELLGIQWHGYIISNQGERGRELVSTRSIEGGQRNVQYLFGRYDAYI